MSDKNAFDEYKLSTRACMIETWEEHALFLKAGSEKVYKDLVDVNNLIKEDINNCAPTQKDTFFLAAGLNNIWMLSVGYSVECLIKAIIIKTTETPIINRNKEVEKQLFGSSHNLYWIIKNKLKSEYHPMFTDDEIQFLYKMFMYIKWRGKYPVPWNAEDISTIYTDKQNNSYKVKNNLGPARLENDIEKRLFESIFDKLHKKYVNANLGSTQINLNAANEVQ